MKWFAVLIIGVFAEGSVAPKCSDPGELLNSVPGIFTAAALTFPTPTIENGDVSADQFKKEFMEARQKYGLAMTQIAVAEISTIGDQLNDAVLNDYAKLKESIQLTSKNDKKTNRSDVSLKLLTKQLNVVLDLIPRNTTSERQQILADLPPQPTEVISQTKNRTAFDYFVNFPKILNDNYASLYGFIAGIYLSGWKEVRNYYEERLISQRSDILNCKVVTVYRKVVENVFEKRGCIQRHVDSETWDSFEKAGVSIITISNDYNKSLKKKGVVNTVQ